MTCELLLLLSWLFWNLIFCDEFRVNQKKISDERVPINQKEMYLMYHKSSRTQMPLRLSYTMTIRRSQGSTLGLTIASCKRKYSIFYFRKIFFFRKKKYIFERISEFNLLKICPKYLKFLRFRRFDRQSYHHQVKTI